MKATGRYVLPTMLLAMIASGSIFGQDKADFSKRIEVTNEYKPTIGMARKLNFSPQMIDTVALRPEISYSISPSPWKTGFTAEPIGPVSISTSEYHPALPFFLRAGVGFPWESLLDVYATRRFSSDSDAGLYLNHRGIWADIETDRSISRPMTQMENRVGGYFRTRVGRMELNGELRYDNSLFTPYGEFDLPETTVEYVRNELWYNAVGGKVVLADRFADLTRMNYAVGLSYDCFDAYGSGQNDLKVSGTLGKNMLGGLGLFEASFESRVGTKRLDAYENWRFRLFPKYAFTANDIKIEAGVKIVYDCLLNDGRMYFYPDIRFSYDAIYSFIPYLVFTGDVGDGSYRALVRENPYVLTGTYGKNPHGIEGRVGARGAAGSFFSYDLFFGFDVTKDYHYFVNALWGNGMQFTVSEDNQVDVLEFGASTNFLIAPGLNFRAGGKANLVVGFSHGLSKDGMGIPLFEVNAGAEYRYRQRFGIAVDAEVIGTRYFMACDELMNLATEKVPTSVNLKLILDYSMSRKLGIFVAGDNLLNQRIYRYNHYPLLGINVMGGVKFSF